MSAPTKGPLWVVGNVVGITGPTCPNLGGATVGEAVAYDDLVFAGKEPDEDLDAWKQTEIVTCGKEVVAIVPHPDKAVRTERAHLLAASWEMREALAYAIDNPEFDPKTFERMTRAALAKAQGERHEG